MDGELEEIKAWAKKVVDHSRPAIEGSENFCSIVTDGYLNDPLCATQFGMAMFMDKPIVLMVRVGTKIPKRLEKIADGIVYFHDEKDLKNASKRLRAILDRLDAEKKKEEGN